MFAPYFYDSASDSEEECTDIDATSIPSNTIIAFTDGSKRRSLPGTIGLYMTSVLSQFKLGLRMNSMQVMENMIKYVKQEWPHESEFCADLENITINDTNNLAEVSAIVQLFIECILHQLEPGIIITDSTYVALQINDLSYKFNNSLTWLDMKKLHQKYKVHGPQFYFIMLVQRHFHWNPTLIHVPAHTPQRVLNIQIGRVFLKTHNIRCDMIWPSPTLTMPYVPNLSNSEQFHHLPSFDLLLYLASLGLRFGMSLDMEREFVSLINESNFIVNFYIKAYTKKFARSLLFNHAETPDELLFEYWLRYGNYIVDKLAQGYSNCISQTNNLN